MTGSVSFPALGSTAFLCVTAPAALARACNELERVLAAIDTACSRFRVDSELSALHRAAGEPVAVSATLFEAVEVALRAAALTDGLVDPTIGRTLRLAGYDRDFDLVRVRSGGSFRATFEYVPGWRHVQLDAAARAVTLRSGVELDLGATAKALAADKAARAAFEATGSGVLVSLGGDVAVAGPAPAGGWAIRIAASHAAPLSSSGPTVAVTEGGLATSSTAVRAWRSGAVRLHHIVDPRTGRPAITPWRTATVVAGSCVDANIGSTAAIVLGEDAPAWLAARGLPALLVRRRGAPSTVAGWPAEAA